MKFSFWLYVCASECDSCRSPWQTCFSFVMHLHPFKHFIPFYFAFMRLSKLYVDATSWETPYRVPGIQQNSPVHILHYSAFKFVSNMCTVHGLLLSPNALHYFECCYCFSQCSKWKIWKFPWADLVRCCINAFWIIENALWTGWVRGHAVEESCGMCSKTKKMLWQYSTGYNFSMWL